MTSNGDKSSSILCKTQIILNRGVGGGAPKSEIWRDGVLKIDAPGAYLDCDSFLSFWVEWTDGLIRLGLGNREDGIAVCTFSMLFQIIIDQPVDDSNIPYLKILKDGDVMTEQHTALLKCDRFHYFWVSWTEGLIQFGATDIPGDVAVNEIIKLERQRELLRFFS